MSPNYPSSYGAGLAIQCYFSLPDLPGDDDHRIAISVLDFKLQGESKSLSSRVVGWGGGQKYFSALAARIAEELSLEGGILLFQRVVYMLYDKGR